MYNVSFTPTKTRNLMMFLKTRAHFLKRNNLELSYAVGLTVYGTKRRTSDQKIKFRWSQFRKSIFFNDFIPSKALIPLNHKNERE